MKSGCEDALAAEGDYSHQIGEEVQSGAAISDHRPHEAVVAVQSAGSLGDAPPSPSSDLDGGSIPE